MKAARGRRPLSVFLSAREVVAAGEPFRPRGEPLSDPGVALDEILSLRAAQEPLVLRVEATGGAATERAAVEGDWLCDVGEEPARLPRPSWGCSRESREWSSRRPWIDAWEQCERGSWMLHAACSEAPVPRWLVALAVCDCVRSCPSLSAAGDPRPREAVEAVERWAEAAGQGVADLALLRAVDEAAEGAMGAARAAELDALRGALSPEWYAARAAAHAAYLVSSPHPNTAAAEAADASSSVVDAEVGWSGTFESRRAARDAAEARLASKVRARLRTIHVLRAAAGF